MTKTNVVVVFKQRGQIKNVKTEKSHSWPRHIKCCFKGGSLVLQMSNVVSIVMNDGVAYNIVQHTFKRINKKCFVQVFSTTFVYLMGDQGWMERALHTDSTLYFTRKVKRFTV